MHDAFIAAVEHWPREGVPDNPRAWLVSTGRFKAIDAMRRRARFDAALGELATQIEAATNDASAWDDQAVEDDRLRLIFTCCHPALTPDAQVALTLREVCGLTTEEIARAFLTTPSTVAQRIVRAKTKIRDARIPYQVPERADIPGTTRYRPPRSSIWCSTKGIRRQPASRSRVMICRERPFAWVVCSRSCCPKRRSSVCSR
jgi:RNA polymerase sigma-70 factor (ECF subfamily)